MPVDRRVKYKRRTVDKQFSIFKLLQNVLFKRELKTITAFIGFPNWEC